ncbi:hypothetical protein G4B88_011401 [Cannabis sativa]|uniref:Amine oxidase domain-containing protein n=1 Tax=Cannabis sativa TaxID=3483 RepID=A0A7J6GJW7_CANSA|nr:hypothetical protein G4B88_011401 [Cannabis sativa]
MNQIGDRLKSLLLHMSLVTNWRLTVTVPLPQTLKSFYPRYGTRVRCVAGEALPDHINGGSNEKKRKNKVVVVGSGWAGLGAAHHLCNQGFDVTVLDGDNGFGGLEDVGIRGYWNPYRNIYSLVDELGIKPFTNWTKSAQYSEEGLEFLQLPLADRLTSLPFMAAAIDFDNTDTAWRKYDSITARELFKQFGCSERFYKKVIGPLLHVGLFAPAEQCSAAATLGMLYYIILAHQKDFDAVWCRGTVREKIFEPWIDSMKAKGCEFAEGRKVTDFSLSEETGCVSAVICGKEIYDADAVILAVGISTLQDLIKNSAVMCTREEFLKILNLNTIDVLSVKLWLDNKVNIPYASNACSGFDASFGWTFFHLNAIQDEYKDNPVSYHANELLPLKDEFIVSKAMSYLSNIINGLENCTITQKEIKRFPKSLPHFFPDWIVNRHGSWAQEKSYVSGLESANLVVDYLEQGSFAKIIPVEEDEPHIEALRTLNRRINELTTQLPLSDYFL